VAERPLWFVWCCCIRPDGQPVIPDLAQPVDPINRLSLRGISGRSISIVMLAVTAIVYIPSRVITHRTTGSSSGALGAVEPRGCSYAAYFFIGAASVRRVSTAACWRGREAGKERLGLAIATSFPIACCGD